MSPSTATATATKKTSARTKYTPIKNEGEAEDEATNTIAATASSSSTDDMDVNYCPSNERLHSSNNNNDNFNNHTNDNGIDASSIACHQQQDHTTTAAATTVRTSTSTRRRRRTSMMLGFAFWCLGICNNASYVIMIASAKSISEGGTALVFLANVLPSFVVKITAPYWFDYVPYESRLQIAFVSMVASFALVATSSSSSSSLSDDSNSSHSSHMVWQLVGVALASLQCGLGEASLLAAAGMCDDHNDDVDDDHRLDDDDDDDVGTGFFITCFSSGTGLAGVFGFCWNWWWVQFCGFGLATSLWLAQSLALLYIGIFWIYLHPHLHRHQMRQQQVQEQEQHRARESDVILLDANNGMPDERQPLELTTYRDNADDYAVQEQQNSTKRNTVFEFFQDEDQFAQPEPALPSSSTSSSSNRELAVHEMTFWQRTHFTMTLWPYIIPLFVVYATEYSLQAGTWTAIGFPVSSVQARDEFYEYSNWMYQWGVFVSRSSGVLGTVSMGWLWFMPLLQGINVFIFALVAAYHVWYSYGQLLPLCFGVGLLGGGVYVHGYKRICADYNQRTDQREFALAATSVAESVGIVCADFLGLFIQACLYRTNGIQGAIATCPIPSST